MLNFNRIHEQFIIKLPNWNLVVLKRLNHRLAAKEWYRILGVAEDCEDETLRLAFVHLAKRFHPDSGTSEADATRFSEIETAYRKIRKFRIEQKERDEMSMDAKEFDIKHTAPQHRHYLNYDVGIGTPSKRQKLHTIERAQKAADNVMEHRLKILQAEERNTLVGQDKKHAKNIKTRFGMDRLVEDLIQEAMNKGEFSDLPGMGKPLKDDRNIRNPHVDFVTHKLNEVLIDNGFKPEWIQLSKEIREDTQDLRKRLKVERNKVGHLPLCYADEATWKDIIENFKTDTKSINKKIDKYNLLVPILQKQMLQVKLEDLAHEALSAPPTEIIQERSNVVNTKEENENLFSFIASLFSNKSV